MAPMYNHPPTRYVLLYMCISSLVSSHGYPRRDPPLIVRPYPKMRDASSHSPYITWQPAGMNGGLDYPMRKKPSPLVHDISGPVPMEDVLKEIKKPWNEPFKQPHDWEIIAGFNGTAVMDIYTPSQINSLLDQAKDMEFVFAMSTGHCGTTTLSKNVSYYEIGYDPSKCHFEFEFLGNGVRDFTRRYPSLEAANKLVSGYLLPTIIKQTLQSGKKCFVDLGHHTMLGHLLSALKVQLKERMKVVRIRRQRTSVAISYALNKRKEGPCELGCIYCICPDEQHFCLPISSSAWQSFYPFMRFLWMNDEVECKWQRYLLDFHPESFKNKTSKEYWEVDWKEKLEPYVKQFALEQNFEELVSFDPNTTLSQNKRHVRPKGLLVYPEERTIRYERNYRKHMKFTNEQKKMIEKSLFF